MYKKTAFTVLTIVLIISISCGCISDDSDNKRDLKDSPITFAHRELGAVLDGEYHETSMTYIQADLPVQDTDKMYLGYEPPVSETYINLKVINEGTTAISNIRVGLKPPENWEVRYMPNTHWDVLQPNMGFTVIIYLNSEPIPKYLGLDTDEDGFADLFDPDNNELGLDCYNNNDELKYPQVFSDGLLAREYKFKVEAWADGVSKTNIEYTVEFKD